MSVTATLSLNEPTATAKAIEIFGNWILVDGFWNNNNVWVDNIIFGRNYLTDPVEITSVEITDITAIAEIN